MDQQRELESKNVKDFRPIPANSVVKIKSTEQSVSYHTKDKKKSGADTITNLREAMDL